MSKLSIPRRPCRHCGAGAPFHLHWCPEVRPSWETVKRASEGRTRWRGRAAMLIAAASAALLVWLERGGAA